MSQKAEFEALSKGALLEVLLPSTDKFNAVAILKEGNTEEIRRAPSRKHVFLDEQTSFQIVLRTSVSQDAACKLLPSLELTISAHATNAVPEGPGNAAAASGKHDIASTKAPATSDVDVVSVKDQTYVIWKPTLHLVRPRVRLQRPAVYFTVNLGLQSNTAVSIPTSEKQYLTSFEPLPANVLESLHHDPSLGPAGREIHVSETRVTKVSPSASQLEDMPRPLRGATKRAFPAVPAFFMRMGYSSLPDAAIASLHVEISPLIAGQVSLDDVRMALPGTTTESLNGASWPQRSQAGDEVVLLYRIGKPSSGVTLPPKDMDLAVVSIEATAFLDQDATVRIETQWQAQVDMTHSQKSASYKWSRPLSAGNAAHRRMLSQNSSRPSTHDMSQGATKDGEIIFTFTAPPTITQGSDFEIQVQCLNKSNRNRRFALVTGQRRGSSATMKPRFEKRSGSNETAVTNTAHIPRTSEATEQPGVRIITPDIRIGPLTAGACFETSLKYHAEGAGVLDFGAIKLIDLESRQTLEIAELPDVISLEQQG